MKDNHGMDILMEEMEEDNDDSDDADFLLELADAE